MLRRVETVHGSGAGGASGRGADSVEDPVAPHGVPAPAVAGSPSGDLDALLDTRPVFGTRVHGYDRLQVDDYVRWAEDELAAARRAGDQLLTRFAACAAELAELRRQPASTPGSPDLTTVSERVREILRLASDEAAAMVEAATEEADQIVADAQAEAQARLEKTALMRDAAMAMAEQLRERAARERAESVALLEQARREADELLRAAAAERDRLAAEATEQRAADAQLARQQRDSAAAVAAGRLLAVKDEAEDLRRQRDAARESLRRLAEQVAQALAEVGADAPDERVVRSVPEPVAS